MVAIIGLIQKAVLLVKASLKEYLHLRAQIPREVSKATGREATAFQTAAVKGEGAVLAGIQPAGPGS